MKPTVLFVSPVDYNALKQRHQGLACEIANFGCKVIYLNPIRSGGLSLVSKQSEGLTVVDVKIPIKASAYPFIHFFCVKMALRMLLKKLNLKPSECVLWLADPACAAMTGFKWKWQLYDCCDLHGAFPGQKEKAWRIYENFIVSNVDLITVSHPYLAEHLKSNFNNKIVLMPNATSLSIGLITECVKNTKNKKLSVVKAVSSGAHFEWVDTDWLLMLSKIPGFELHIAGTGRGKGFEELIKQKSVVYHGKLSQQELAKLLAECHVGLLPFKDIELIKGVDPIKIYDYAALGLDIWSPKLNSLSDNKLISDFIGNSAAAEKAVQNLLVKPSGAELNTNAVVTWRQRLKESGILQFIETF